MTNEISTYLAPLPGRIKACIVRKDGFYSIVVNECLNERARLKAYHHELDHLNNGDLESDETADWIEQQAHDR